MLEYKSCRFGEIGEKIYPKIFLKWVKAERLNFSLRAR